MKDNSKYVAIVLAILAVIVIIISLIGETNTEKSNYDTLIVTNPSNFYTVNSCLYRVITYLSEKDTDSLNLVVNDNYKKNNNVTKKNILDLFSDVDPNSTFVSEKMYYETINSNLTKYYVKGHIEANQILDDVILEDKNYDSVYFIVYLNTSNNLFSIEPYDGEIFKVGDNIEK